MILLFCSCWLTSVLGLGRLPAQILYTPNIFQWRYWLIYEYGGIYVDVDEAPGPKLFSPHDPDDIFKETYDGFMISYYQGIAQYFFAFAPKHSFLYYNLLQVFANLYSSMDIGAQYVPYVTGTYVYGVGYRDDGQRLRSFLKNIFHHC